MTSSNGKKEAEIRALREESADMPDFLKRTETPEQAEKRRAKYKPKDTADGLKVKKLPEPPPPAVAKALAKDFGDKVAKINVKLAEKEKIALNVLKKKAASKTTDVEAKPKKVGKLVARALAARDALAQKASKAKEHDMKPAAKKVDKPAGKAKKTSDKKSSARSAEKADKMIEAFKRKNGVTNADLAKILGARPSASVMRKVCETRDLKLKIVKKEGEPTRYMI